MSQILRTKKFGDLEVEHGGWQEGPIHIVRLTNGAYCYREGLPIRETKEFKEAGMKGADLVAAEAWFKRRHDTEGNPPQGVIFKPDGSLMLEDETPVTQSAQLIQALPPGEFLDAALKGLYKWQEAQKGPSAAAKRREAAKKIGPVAPKRKGAKKGKSIPARVAPAPTEGVSHAA